MKILVIAPHPDDETLGCGGTLFRHKKEGDELYWGIITGISVEDGWTTDNVEKRDIEINTVERKYGFKEVFNFRFPTTKINPEIIYIPFMYDVHTDHQLVTKALQSTFKWFRYPHIQKVLMYETLSETEFNFMEERTFRPNVFMDITHYLEDKIETMKIYASEMDKFPFPRSEKTMRSLAVFRGSQSGFEAAEAFELVYERK